MTIIEKLGKYNVVSYFIYHLNTEGDELVENVFCDEKLFSISIQSPWFADVANYLVIGKVPPYFSLKKRKHLVKKKCNIQMG